MFRSYLLLRFAWSPAALPALLGLAGCSAVMTPASDRPDGGAGAKGAPLPDGSGVTPAPTSNGFGPGTDGATGNAAAVAAVPGRFLTSTATVGTGTCLGVSLADVLAKIRAAEPTVADIQSIYSPANPGDGSFIYPYARSDGGFDVVFKRGLGDCPAGCTENDYLYFATDTTCQPVRVGHFHAGWGAGTCLTIDGAPMWNHPPPPDPVTVCGQDGTPGELAGTYKLRAVGQRTPCTAVTAATAKASALDEAVTLVIQQNAKDSSTGTVTFTGTGHPLVDGVPLPAYFQRRRFDAAQSTFESSCSRGNTVTARYDFEGYQPGGIEVTELGDETCAPCKGSMSLTLTP